MKVDNIWDRILTIIAADLQKELTCLCEKRKSVLRNPTADSIKRFSWDKLLYELDTRAPIFI